MNKYTRTLVAGATVLMMITLVPNPAAASEEVPVAADAEPQVLLIPGGDLSVIEVPENPASHIHTLRCSGTITGVLGGTQSCSASASVDNGFTIRTDVTWTLLARGSNSWTLRDPVGTYYGGGCVAFTPVITSNDIACDAALLRTFVFLGTHTASVTHRYNDCVWAFLGGCGWSVTNTLTET